MKRRSKTFYKEVDVEVEISIEDIVEFIEDYASELELEQISEVLSENLQFFDSTADLFIDRRLDGSFIRREKLELLSAAYAKFSLDELEQKLGTKFDLL